MLKKLIRFLKVHGDTVVKVCIGIGAYVFASSARGFLYDVGAKTSSTFVSKNPTVGAIRSYAMRAQDMSWDSYKYDVAKKIQEIALDHTDDDEAKAYAIYAIGNIAEDMTWDSYKSSTLNLMNKIVKKEE